MVTEFIRIVFAIPSMKLNIFTTPMNLCVKVTLDECVRPIVLESVLTASVLAKTKYFILIGINGSVKYLTLRLFLHQRLVQKAHAANGRNVKSHLTRK